MVVVKIQQGTLIGGISQTENGSQYYEFLEVPYAKPPIGDLRFKSPQLPDSWEGERLATTATKRPSQYDPFVGNVDGTEDCLYLNVYTTTLPSPETKPLPVMVYIHGGGFAFGNGTIKQEGGPDYFVNEEVVLVFINYRLNVFGFLSLDIPEAAGNMGLKDQVLALKWVQNNIEQFGGDKNNVTLFGISAGGASIEYLMLAPQAKSLFHKVIIQSGSTLNHWAIVKEAKPLAYKLAKELGFEGSPIDYRGIYHFIFKQSTDDIQKTFMKLLNSDGKLRTSFGFVPCVEKDFCDNDAFLTENPYTLLKNGKFNKVPVIRGFCDAEGFLTKGMTPQAYKMLTESRNFIQHWPYKLDESDKLNEKFENAYINVNSNQDFALDFFNDFDFIGGIWTSTKLMLNRDLPVYMYEFSYEGEVNLFKKLFGIQGKGTAHGDDSAYILKLPNFETKSTKDVLIRDRFVRMWTNFAKYGNPTPQTDALISIKWPAFNKESMTYLNINEELSLKSNYQSDRMDVFREIYDKYKI